MDIEQEEKKLTRKRCKWIIKNRSIVIKLVIKYNVDGIYVGQVATHLISYLGVFARTMVPIKYNT